MNNSINLYNPELRRKKVLFSALHIMIGLVIISISAFIFYGYHINLANELRKTETKLGQMINNQQNQINLLAADLALKKTNMAKLAETIQTTKQQLNKQRQLFLILSEALSYRYGYSRYLRALARQSLEGLWLTGFNIEGIEEKLLIRGNTINPELIPRYLARLRQESELQGKIFNNLIMTRPNNKDKKPLSVNKNQLNINDTLIIEFVLTALEK